MEINDAIELAKEDMYNRYRDKLSSTWSKKKRQILHDQYEDAIGLLDELKITAIIRNCTIGSEEELNPNLRG